MKRIALWLVTTAAIMAVVRAEAASPKKAPGGAVAAKARQASGEGGWQAGASDAAGPALQWRGEVTRGQDGSVKGKVTVTGHANVHTANIKGVVTGTRMEGTLTDDKGTQVATFAGDLDPGGAHGTYTGADGEVGSWTWEGAAKK